MGAKCVRAATEDRSKIEHVWPAMSGKDSLQVWRSSLLLGVRLGCFDGVPYRKREDGVGEPYPFETPYPMASASRGEPVGEEPYRSKAAIGLFREAGAAFFNISIGCPYYNPHVTRPFETPDDGNYLEPEHPCTAWTGTSESPANCSDLP